MTEIEMAKKKNTRKVAHSSHHFPVDRMSIQELQEQLKEYQRHVSKLERKRSRLMTKLEEVDLELLQITGLCSMKVRRPKNVSNLGDALVKVLRSKELSVSEATKAVQSVGYHSTAQNFRVIVNQRLINDPRFKKVRRGIYTTK